MSGEPASSVAALEPVQMPAAAPRPAATIRRRRLGGAIRAFWALRFWRTLFALVLALTVALFVGQAAFSPFMPRQANPLALNLSQFAPFADAMGLRLPAFSPPLGVLPAGEYAVNYGLRTGFYAALTIFVLSLRYLHRRIAGLAMLAYWGLWLAFLPMALWEKHFSAAAGAARYFPLPGDVGPALAQPHHQVLGLAMGAVLWMFVLGAVLSALELLLARRNDFLSARGVLPKLWPLPASFASAFGAPFYLVGWGGKVRGGAAMAFLAQSVLAALFTGLLIRALMPANSESVVEAALRGASSLPLLIAFVLAALFAAFLVGRLARRGLARSYADARKADPRHPLVFLRAFPEQHVRLEFSLPTLANGFALRLGEPRTLDEMLLEIGSPYGPVVPIGPEDEKLPDFGAASTYVRGADWRSAVSSLALDGRAVILALDESDTVVWQRKLITRENLGDKTIVVFNPALSAAARRDLMERTMRLLGQPKALPERGVIIGIHRAPDGAWILATAWRATRAAHIVYLQRALMDLFGYPSGVHAKPKLAPPAVVKVS